MDCPLPCLILLTASENQPCTASNDLTDLDAQEEGGEFSYTKAAKEMNDQKLEDGSGDPKNGVALFLEIGLGTVHHWETPMT